MPEVLCEISRYALPNSPYRPNQPGCRCRQNVMQDQPRQSKSHAESERCPEKGLQRFARYPIEADSAALTLLLIEGGRTQSGSARTSIVRQYVINEPSLAHR